MGYIRGADRNAVLLFPECVEDYINDDNPVRFVDAFVESLDLVDLGFERARAEVMKRRQQIVTSSIRND